MNKLHVTNTTFNMVKSNKLLLLLQPAQKDSNYNLVFRNSRVSWCFLRIFFDFDISSKLPKTSKNHFGFQGFLGVKG